MLPWSLINASLLESPTDLETAAIFWMNMVCSRWTRNAKLPRNDSLKVLWDFVALKWCTSIYAKIIFALICQALFHLSIARDTCSQSLLQGPCVVITKQIFSLCGTHLRQTMLYPPTPLYELSITLHRRSKHLVPRVLVPSRPQHQPFLLWSLRWQIVALQ